MSPRFLLKMLLAFAGLVGIAPEGFADWTLNVGYHNPRPATYGVNFLYLGSQWGFEAGIGWIDVNAEKSSDDDDDDATDGSAKDDDGDASFAVAGDVDVKYFLASGGVRPYLQFGLGAGFGADDDSGFNAGAGGPFGGIGLLAGSPSLYVYVAGTVDGAVQGPRLEAGVGFDL